MCQFPPPGTFQGNPQWNMQSMQNQSNDGAPKRDRNLDHKISNSIHTVHKVPKTWQIKTIEGLNPLLDCTLTGQCEPDLLSVVVWQLTGIQPNHKLCDLQCDYFEDLAKPYKAAADRQKDRENILSENRLLCNVNEYKHYIDNVLHIDNMLHISWTSLH